jgi:prephenate dehydrogenase
MEIITNNIALIFTGLSSILASVWAYINSKRNKELETQLLQKDVESNTLDVTAKNMQLYQDMMDDIKKRFEATIEEYRADVERLKLLLEESRDTIGRQEEFLREKNAELDRLKEILTDHKIKFDEKS